MSEIESKTDSEFGHDYAHIGDLTIKAAENRVHISGTWGEAVFGTWSETVEEAFQRLKEFAEKQPDPRPDPENEKYRCEGDEPFWRCLNCGQLTNADHHEIVGEQVVRCDWDNINDFEMFDELGRVTKCPECGGHVRDRPIGEVDGLHNVECRDCDATFYRQSHDFGQFDAGKQELRTADGKVVARVH